MVWYCRVATTQFANMLVPVCDISGASKTMLVYSADRTEVGVMIDSTVEVQASIVAEGGSSVTRASLSDIFDFPVAFPPIPPLLG